MEAQKSPDYISAWGMSKYIGIHMALRTALELNVFDIIAKSGLHSHLTPTQIISQIPTTNPHASIALDRLLRFLSANSLLSVSQTPTENERAYGLTEETRCLVTNENGMSSAPMVLLSSEKEIVESIYVLKNVVLEPNYLPFYKTHGVSFFEYVSKKPRLNRLFNETMASSAKLIFEKVFDVYKGFGEVEELMDVGGGIGASLVKILSVYPHIHCINFDLPHVIAEAPKIEGVKHVAGDMYESLPNAQTILLKWILHDWDDEQCKELLKNCWKSLPNEGKVIVLEHILPEIIGNDAESVNIVGMDLYMMVMNPGGRERTIAEYHYLAKSAGFSDTKCFPILQGTHIIEFHKKI